MNTNKLKRFASKSRELLINEVTKNIKYLEVRDINKLPSYYQNWVQIDDVSFKEWKKLEQRKALITRVSEIWEEQVIEEIAYLWFNRFIALRYMEVNNYLSYGSRVVSSDDKNKLEPDLIKNATHLIWLDLDNSVIYDFLDKSDNDKLYKYLIIHICNSLHSELPFMFEKISDYSELLFPESLLEKWSFLDLLINEVDEEDFKEVEILGWLYQYYISDKKDIVFNEMKTKKKKISKENIPAATQLFTPKWIVKYMVQNSVWKTWLESHPNTELQAKWEYYIESESTTESNPNLKPEEITVLDPAMWSWHILVYAFEILFDIYKSAGYTEDEIPKLIIENNLYWLEIDDRAWQIACFAIMMKARKYDRKILKQWLEPKVCSIQESSECDKIDELIYPELSKLCIAFKQWKLLWSLITLKEFDLEKVNKEFEALQNENSIFNVKLVQRLPFIIKQAELIYKKYSCVVSNPPYMWAGWMDKDLTLYLKKNYNETKSWFIFQLLLKEILLLLHQNDSFDLWHHLLGCLFQSYQSLRELIINNKTISSLIQLEYGSFSREVIVPICTFVLRNYNSDIKWDYIKLSDFKWVDLQPIKTLEAINEKNISYRYSFDTKDFISIPSTPIAYWVSNRVRKIFENEKKIDNIAEVITWMTLWDNNKHMRYWSEINNLKINLWLTDISQVNIEKSNWIPYQKWWDCRKFYWNNTFVINWANSWKFNRAKTTMKYLYFRKWITWSFLTSNFFNCRFMDVWYLWDVAWISSIYR